VVFSAGGDGDRKSPELLAQRSRFMGTGPSRLSTAQVLAHVGSLALLGRVLSNAHIASLYGAGRPLRRVGPARFGSYRKQPEASVSAAQAAWRAWASVAVTTVTDLLFGYPIIFWTTGEV
jgi:hypothetical protein